MVYHLYITNKNYSSWSLRPWLLMKVLKIPFTEHFEALTPGSMRQPQWKSFSPTAHVPCLHDVSSSDSAAEKIILWESLSIIEYLAEAHPSLPIYPSSAAAMTSGSGSHADRQIRAWARSAVAEMHAGFSALRNEMGMNIGLRIQLTPEDVTPSLERDLARLDELWTEGLERFGGPFLAGAEFTVVDAFYAPVVLRLQTYVGAMGYIKGERARGWVEMMLGLEEMGEWVDDALGETWREPVHDGESLMVGVGGRERRLLEDLRAV